MARIVLGVAGGIAAYKACELLRRLRESGHDVTVVPTPNALNFVGETTWAALAGHPIRTTVWADADEVPHVALGRAAELVVVAPATADLLARAATGRADDLLTNVLLTATCPVVMAPAMHTEMWLNAATQANVATLRSRGVLVVDPASGRLTGKDSGPGRLPEPADLLAVVESVLAAPDVVARGRDLAGRRVVISAGGTREPVDGVRFLANQSSGRMGVALARAAALRGAKVELVCGSVDVPAPGGVDVERVLTTAELGEAMRRRSEGADVVVMAAAPADFTAANPTGEKIKKDGSGRLTLELVETEDVLRSLVERRAGERPVLVGFAAETAGSPERLVEIATAKRARKGCDLIVANDVSGGAVFGSDQTATAIVGERGVVAEASGPKAVVAHAILDAAADVL